MENESKCIITDKNVSTLSVYSDSTQAVSDEATLSVLEIDEPISDALKLSPGESRPSCDDNDNKKNPHFLTPTQLRNYIHLAQKERDEHAINALCTAFTPLIMKEANNSYVRGILGEDAVNIAWEIFLNFIYSYKGTKYRILPGLIAKTLHYEFLHKLHEGSLLNDCDSLDNFETTDSILADPKDYFTESDGNINVIKLLKTLTPNQREVIIETVIKGRDVQDYCQEHNITFQAVYKTKTAALMKLRKLITE